MSAVSSPRFAPRVAVSPGLVDLHFHGALGVDLMTASPKLLDSLCPALLERGLGGFLATTLSAPPKQLRETVGRLGLWIESVQKEAAVGSKRAPGALPFGIHLEGPFLAPSARGAHPSHAVRSLQMTELEALWSASRGTLKLITVAPEACGGTPSTRKKTLKRLALWAWRRKIRLSLGHTQVGYGEALEAFQSGFRGLTHAWNAMPFHHRDPGPLGAALGNPKVFIELIADGVHTHPRVAEWTAQLHARSALCLVSDCVCPGGLKPGSLGRFGELEVVAAADGSTRLRSPKAPLAGGGQLLPETFRKWAGRRSLDGSPATLARLKSELPWVTTVPVKSISLNPSLIRRWLKQPKLRWSQKQNGQVHFERLRSGV